jgi:hypothetical protein
MRLIKFIPLSLLFFLLISCEEPFNPQSELRERYILYCILRGDSSFQSAILSKSYIVDGFDPSVNKIEPVVYGAEIKVWHGDSVYIFKDSTIIYNYDSRYDSTFLFYYNKNFNPSFNQNYEIEALLKDGRRLKASLRTPGDFSFSNQSEVIIPPVSNTMIEFIWNSQTEGVYYLPRLIFTYYKNENGTNKKFIKEIPTGYKNDVPLFPQASFQRRLNIEQLAVDKILAEISAGDQNKANYSVEINLTAEVLVFDQNLTRYLSSTSSTLNDLTARVDENDYTNIEGGFGVFGAFLKKQYNLKFEADYIRSFGYNPVF